MSSLGEGLQRTAVSMDELIRLLNEELSNHRECSECRFVGPIRKAIDPYPDGGNWIRHVTVRGKPDNAEACGAIAADVVVLIAAGYNLV
jgi:hypothetical protein